LCWNRCRIRIARKISRSFHASDPERFTAGDCPPDEPARGFAVSAAFTTEETMNTQTNFPTWSTRLAVAAVAVGIAMVAAAAIANVPRPNAPFEYGTATYPMGVLSDEQAHRKAFAAAMNGSYATGFVEFDDNDQVAMLDDELGPLSETLNPEIVD
jgi:hypothetical protein